MIQDSGRGYAAISSKLPSATIHENNHLIKEYIKELGAPGILDDDSSKEINEQQNDIHANSKFLEKVQELPNHPKVKLNVPQTHDEKVDIQRLGNLKEQSLSDSLYNRITEDVESEPPPAASRTPASQKIDEQLRPTTEYASIRSRVEIKSQSDYNSSNPLRPAEWKESLAQDDTIRAAVPTQRDQQITEKR